MLNYREQTRSVNFKKFFNRPPPAKRQTAINSFGPKSAPAGFFADPTAVIALRLFIDLNHRRKGVQALIFGVIKIVHSKIKIYAHD